MKLLMAEDLESVRQHLGELLAETADVELRFVAQEASQLMQAAADWQPDVAILDLRLRGMMTLGALETLKRKWPDMSVVVSGFFFEPYYRTAFLRHGADFFFDKSLEWGDLLAFLRQRMAQPASNPVDANRMTPLQVSQF